jgi:hypothetical protein
LKGAYAHAFERRSELVACSCRRQARGEAALCALLLLLLLLLLLSLVPVEQLLDKARRQHVRQTRRELGVLFKHLCGERAPW